MTRVLQKRKPVSRPVDWEADAADQLEQLILAANEGAWPATRGQWRRVCESFGICAYISNRPLLWDGAVLDRTILIRDSPDRWRILWVLCHEVCEAIQTQHVAPELKTPGDIGSAHRIARAVDLRYQRFLAYIRAFEEDALESAIRRSARPGGRLRYSSADSPDPPFDE